MNKTLTFNDKQIQDMYWAALPLMRWLTDNCHPHCTAIVDSERVEVMEGLATAKKDSAFKEAQP